MTATDGPYLEEDYSSRRLIINPNMSFEESYTRFICDLDRLEMKALIDFYSKK